MRERRSRRDRLSLVLLTSPGKRGKMVTVSSEAVQSPSAVEDVDITKNVASSPSSCKEHASSPSTVSQASQDDHQTPAPTLRMTSKDDEGTSFSSHDNKDNDLSLTTPKNNDDEDDDEEEDEDEENEDDDDDECNEDWNGNPWSPDEVSSGWRNGKRAYHDEACKSTTNAHHSHLNYCLLYFVHQDKKLKAIVSSRKKATRKKKNTGQLPPEAEEIDWKKVGISMEKDFTLCKERYEFLRMCQGGKGPVPWTRDEDKQILALVAEHGKSSENQHTLVLHHSWFSHWMYYLYSWFTMV